MGDVPISGDRAKSDTAIFKVVCLQVRHHLGAALGTLLERRGSVAYQKGDVGDPLRVTTQKTGDDTFAISRLSQNETDAPVADNAAHAIPFARVRSAVGELAKIHAM